jgi:hypothetical protein
VIPARIDNGVNVQSRCAWLARELAKSLNKLLLQVIVETILLAEEDDASLGDWCFMSILVHMGG